MCLTGCSTDKQKPPSKGKNAGGKAAKKSKPCEQECPDLEIQVNETAAGKDDLVALHCEHPPGRPTVKCRVRAKTACPTSTKVVLTNPDGRLRFPGPAQTTKTVTVPSGGGWAAFTISGESQSQAVGDAVIEAHCKTAGGAVKGTAKVTVFWFDQAEIKITPGGSYSLTGGTLTATGGNAVDYEAKARIRPSGVDCTAPQVKDLRIGILQNQPKQLRTLTWDTPTLKSWEATAPKGTEVEVKNRFRLTINVPITTSDSTSRVKPVYDRPGLPGAEGTLDPNSLKSPNGCTGAGTATSNDTPGQGSVATLDVDANDSGGTKRAVVTYSNLVNVTMDLEFVTWVVVLDTSNDAVCALRQRKWNLKVDSAAGGTQKAKAEAETDPDRDPILTAPFSNDAGSDPANRSLAGIGAATTKFKKP
jgi:hypothetical protein